jgi:ribonucleoside-diphosphate reductase beta chain
MPYNTQRLTYKPFEYPWAFTAWQDSEKLHWLPDEVNFQEDVKDWNTRLSPEEKEFLRQIFRFFVIGDLDVASSYIDHYLPEVKTPELRMMMLSFAAREAVHVSAYATLLDTVGMPDTEYEAFTQYRQMREKHDYFFNDDELSLPLKIVKYSAFGEGLQLFSSFAMLLNFPRFNKMKGMGQIVSWSIRDEQDHVRNMIKLYHEIIAIEGYRPGHDTKLLKIARSMVDLEMNFIDLAFEMRGVQGLGKEEVKEYVRYICNLRLAQLDYPVPLFPDVKDNPLPWLEDHIQGLEFTNFFENAPTNYQKGVLTGEIDYSIM